MTLGRGAICRAALLAVLFALGNWTIRDAPAQSGPPDAPTPIQNDVGEARSLIREGRYQDAIALLRRADDASQGRCVPCLESLADAFAGLEAHHNVADVERRLIALQPDESILADAYQRLGQALLAEAKTEPDALEEAAKAFRTELELTEDEAAVAHYYLGETLIRQGKRDEGVAELQVFLKREPTAQEARAARQYVADPSCVLEPCIPDLAVLTRAGELVPISTYRGRVLVLFFWGPWSDFNTRALAELQRVARKYSDKPVDFLAVSGETDRDAFVQATEGWEYVPAPVSDPQGALAMALEIRMWPTTIVVDHAGKIVYRASTWGRRAPQALRRALREALKAAGS